MLAAAKGDLLSDRFNPMQRLQEPLLVLACHACPVTTRQMVPAVGGMIRLSPRSLALQLRPTLEVSLHGTRLMASPPGGPCDDESRLDPPLG